MLIADSCRGAITKSVEHSASACDLVEMNKKKRPCRAIKILFYK